MAVSRLFINILFLAFALVSAALAEENIALNTHLGPPPQDGYTEASFTPQLTPSTHLSLPSELNEFSASPAVIANSKLPDADSNTRGTLIEQVVNKEINMGPSPAEPISPKETIKPEQNPDKNATPDPILTPGDLWTRIRNGFAMPEFKSKLITRHEKWYASRPEYIARMTERSQRYLFYITEEVERRGMPAEIALLPMIESAFNPGAYSTGRASGIWQFIPSTGKNFGMQQNWWYDGRRDIISATNGALDYLQQLHEQFGDWELALAAYNWGEGAVAHAQAHNRRAGKPTNYASLRMPRETQNYVPKLLAIKNIISNPERYGLKLTGIPNKPYFAAVTTNRPIDVKLAAELADISLEEFIALNPSHNRPVILCDTANVILLPIDKMDTFQTNLENTNQRLVSWQPYQTKKGERFDQLAPRFGLSANKLRSINGLSAHTKISNGQTLLVPANDSETSETGFTAFNTNLVSIDETVPRRLLTHTVRKGETLASIAHRYHVKPASLKEWNSGLANHLKVGQRITIAQAAGHGHKRHLARVGRRHATKLARNNKTHTSRTRLKVAYNR